MLVSLNKNIWLWDYIYDRIDEEELGYNKYMFGTYSTNTPHEIRIKFLNKMAELGYKVKITSSDVIIPMTEEEYMFLKLKYG